MNTYLCSWSALHFLRTWSQARPLPLRAFHDLKRVTNSLLPLGQFATVDKLANCAFRYADILTSAKTVDLRELFGAQAQHPTSSDGGADHDDLPFLATLGEEPLHVLARNGEGTRNSSRVVRHRTSTTLFPRHSFLRIAPRLFVCSPELVFVQLAAVLPFGELLALGYELCGCYPLPSSAGSALVRRPLTTPERLVAYAEELHGSHGVKLARAVARNVQARSASPMETEVAALALTPVKQGGFGLPPARLNHPIALPRKTGALTRTGRVVCDLYWEDNRVALEYDGRESHGTARHQDRDSRKRDALSLSNIDLITLTSAQFHSVTEFSKLMKLVARLLGKQTRKRSAAYLDRHMALRRQLRIFHELHSPLK